MPYSRSEKVILGVFMAITLLAAGYRLGTILAQPAHPVPENTIQHGVGLFFDAIDANDYFYRGYNVTAFMEAVADWLENSTIPTPVWEDTVEWGLVYGQTGDWFNHSLPGEPIYVGLQMHPDNLTIGGDYVIPNVYDKADTQWQLELVWMGNGTQCFKDCLVMYHMRWEPPLNGEPVDPNEPTYPNQEEPPL